MVLGTRICCAAGVVSELLTAIAASTYMKGIGPTLASSIPQSLVWL